ncbi:hypothetical protein MATL_G00233720 [Megalops atlanticus]|uniref:Neural chondroitin sulphate proteoglycan cytoplasmic domain-containing protein n=1 Tax=Megalops atlanticus TaxID=7932 RepID=A0A9D3SW04_MEGAT|nr:hypothetical protein MATL_G00233720 [Megalops atlanticus]
MDGREIRFCSGFWRLVMLSSFFVLHLIPLCAHGGPSGLNVTVADSKVNSSSLTGGEDQQEAAVTGSATPFALTLRAGRMPRGGEEPGSGMLGEAEISPDSAEKDHLLEVPPEGMGASLPTLPTPQGPADVQLDFKEEEHTDPPWQGTKGGLDGAPSAHELQGGDPTSFTLSDFYYFDTKDDSYSTSEIYPDGDLYTTTDMQDENIMLLATTPQSVPFDPRAPGSFTPDDVLPSGAEDEEPPAPPGVVDSTNGSDCLPGYVRSNNTCRSPCDLFPSYCLNGGQCYLAEGIGVFCRCNSQDYIWHKGSRCESVITEFQVMCIAIGAAALMVLLLFMITVFFAKKLHLLKTENRRLRKRSSKYRPPSEQHNDNFSLSTIAEGSHPNVRKLCDTPPTLPHARALAYYDNIICQDDPNSQNKLEDPVKAPPPKEDEALNIQNSLTPKHENNHAAGEENSSEVNSLQNNMM